MGNDCYYRNSLEQRHLSDLFRQNSHIQHQRRRYKRLSWIGLKYLNNKFQYIFERMKRQMKTIQVNTVKMIMTPYLSHFKCCSMMNKISNSILEKLLIFQNQSDSICVGPDAYYQKFITDQGSPLDQIKDISEAQEKSTGEKKIALKNQPETKLTQEEQKTTNELKLQLNKQKINPLVDENAQKDVNIHEPEFNQFQCQQYEEQQSQISDQTYSISNITLISQQDVQLSKLNQKILKFQEMITHLNNKKLNFNAKLSNENLDEEERKQIQEKLQYEVVSRLELYEYRLRTCLKKWTKLFELNQQQNQSIIHRNQSST